MAHVRKKRGKKRVVGVVKIKCPKTGQQIRREKLFPDASRNSQREAAIWEKEERERIELELTRQEIVTAYWTIYDWADRYLSFSKKDHVEKTYKEKRTIFKSLIGVFGPEYFVLDIGNHEALHYLSKIFEASGGNVANKHRKNLSVGWSWGKKYLNDFPAADNVMDNRVVNNPFAEVEKFPERRQPRYVPPLDDFWKVLDSTEGQDWVMLTAFLHLAARRNEIFNLKFSDLDFSEYRVRLWTRKRKGGNLEFDWLPMTSDLKDALIWWKKERFHQETVDKEHVFVCLDEWNFCTEYYGRPFKKRQHFMKKACDAAGVKPFGFHAIRHLTPSVLYSKGCELWIIQAIMRHKNPQTTNRYLHRQGLTPAKSALEEGLRRRATVIPFSQKKALKNVS